MESATRWQQEVPTGNRGLLCDISIGMTSSPIKLHTHEALMKTRSNPFSVHEGVTKGEQRHQWTMLRAYKNVAQSNTESVITTAPKVGNFPADRAM